MENEPPSGESSSTTFIPFRATENDTSHYRPLNPTTKEIRVVTLRPSSGDDDDSAIECSLSYTSLDGPHRCQYEALSYCWGDVSDTVPITLLHPAVSNPTGGDTSQQFHVTRNLHTALRRFRSTGANRTFWIDAICINQGDPVERSDQVRFMSQIYSGSERVLVWLGEEDPWSEIAIQLMKLYNDDPMSKLDLSQFTLYVRIDHKKTGEEGKKGEERGNGKKKEEEEREVEEKWARKEMEREEDNEEHDQQSPTLSTLDGLVLSRRDVSEGYIKEMPKSRLVNIVGAVCSLLSRPWFSRVWVVQEILCAPRGPADNGLSSQPKAVINIGKTEVGWNPFFTFLGGFEKLYVERAMQLARSRTMAHMVTYISWKGLLHRSEQDILHLLLWTKRFQASDPRDQLFALLGVSAETKNTTSHLILPDYTKSLVQTCTDFARWHIESTRSLRILLILRTHPVHGLPSWTTYYPGGVGPLPRMIHIKLETPQGYLQGVNLGSRTKSTNGSDAGSGLEFAFSGSSLLALGTTISRIRSVNEQQTLGRDASLKLYVSPATDGHEPEELFEWLLKNYWDPLREPSDAGFLYRSLRMFGVYEGDSLVKNWLAALRCYLEYHGISKRIRDTGFFFTHLGSRILASRRFCQEFYSQMTLMGDGFRFFTTESGQLGLGDGIKEGDLVVALKSAKCPHVLRPCSVPGQEGKYLNVGGCLFHGQQLMTHEMYLPTEERPLEIFEIV